MVRMVALLWYTTSTSPSLAVSRPALRGLRPRAAWGLAARPAPPRVPHPRPKEGSQGGGVGGGRVMVVAVVVDGGGPRGAATTRSLEGFQVGQGSSIDPQAPGHSYGGRPRRRRCQS